MNILKKKHGRRNSFEFHETNCHFSLYNFIRIMEDSWLGKWNCLLIGENWNEQNHDKIIENVIDIKGPLLNLTKDLLKSFLEGMKEGGEPSSNERYCIAGNDDWSDILELLPNAIHEF
jgi:hypothetical protein